MVGQKWPPQISGTARCPGVILFREDIQKLCSMPGVFVEGEMWSHQSLFHSLTYCWRNCSVGDRVSDPVLCGKIESMLRQKPSGSLSPARSP